MIYFFKCSQKLAGTQVYRVEQCKECTSQANLIQLIMICEDKWSLTIYQHKSVIHYLFVHRVYKGPLVLLVEDGICTIM